MFRKRKDLSVLVSVWGIGLFCFSAFLYIFIRLSSDLIEKRPFLFDPYVMDAVRLYASPAMDRFMLVISGMGSIFILGLLLVISMIWMVAKRKNRWGLIFYFITVAGGGLLNLFLKNFFERERPNINLMFQADGFSFPSGHSMGSMTYYGFLVYLVIRSKRNLLSKAGWGVLFGFIILLIGISRIYLGVHYPSDVLAGYMAGGAWLVLWISLLEVVYSYERKKYQSAKSVQRKMEVS